MESSYGPVIHITKTVLLLRYVLGIFHMGSRMALKGHGPKGLTLFKPDH